jgi:hypothetical protein
MVHMGMGKRFEDMTMKAFVLLAAPLLLAASAGSALAWSSDPQNPDPSISSQFQDPDDMVDNLANPSSDGHGTAVSTESNGTGSAHPIQTAPNPADAEPANPGWPMWMTWHQQ